ncbi:MAG TPA: F0F1 ATP synthase subunit delta [Casimicrobiaceae bacterium]|nr:F0F1 ATP synthase subunit delta [Casimicrobiaceae bacterium]
MAERTTVARPYADAAFAIARDANALPQWSEMLRLATSIGEDHRMSDALGSPKLDGAEKVSLFLSVAGDRFVADMRNFIRVLIETDRIDLLPEIRSLFDEARDEAEGVAKATIESAKPLTDAQVTELTSMMGQRLGKRVEATTTINAALIGGARISVGDTMIDGSVRGKLEQMRQALMR